MSSRSTFECFGLVIHGFGWPEVKARIDGALSHGEHLWIVTANPEILLEAKRDPAYWQILRLADLRLVDGAGLAFIGWLFQASPKRLSGVDLAEHLLNEAQTQNWNVLLIGGERGVSDKAAWAMRQKFSRLRISAEEGGRIERDGRGDDTDDEMLQRVTQLAPDIILVAFGHPKQEAWIWRHLPELPSIKVAVGIGGTLDYWAGTKKRAPLSLRSLGLEWLWRLISEPKRWRRIVNAVIVFPIIAINDRVFKKRV